MEQNYFVNPLELAIAAATAAGSGAIAGVCLFLGRFLSALVFLAIALLFFKIALDAGAKISVGKDGVSRRLLGKTTHSFKWEEIAETGAAGSKILNKGNPNKTGTVYIYFSPTALDDNDRFDMMLRWPPKDKLYLRYSEARLNFIKTVCGMDIVGYNIGKLKI